jgi:23S rRNA pseudoU1915 N3-methylase RlmH
MLKYIKHRQKQWEKKWEEEEKRIAEEAEKEEARIAEMQAQARHKKLLIEQQEAKRLRQEIYFRQLFLIVLR